MELTYKQIPCSYPHVERLVELISTTHYYIKALFLQAILVYIFADCTWLFKDKFCTSNSVRTKDTLQTIQLSGYVNIRRNIFEKSTI